MNVFEHAIRMEQDGKDFYLKLAGEAELPALKNIFLRLADDEQKHLETLQALQARVTVPKMQDSKSLEEAKSVFIELQDRREAFGPVVLTLEAYQYALHAEKESLKLYSEAAARESGEEVRRLLLRIANEERKHCRILGNIFEFLQASCRPPDWDEPADPEVES